MSKNGLINPTDPEKAQLVINQFLHVLEKRYYGAINYTQMLDEINSIFDQALKNENKATLNMVAELLEEQFYSAGRELEGKPDDLFMVFYKYLENRVETDQLQLEFIRKIRGTDTSKAVKYLSSEFNKLNSGAEGTTKQAFALYRQAAKMAQS